MLLTTSEKLALLDSLRGRKIREMSPELAERRRTGLCTNESLDIRIEACFRHLLS